MVTNDWQPGDEWYHTRVKSLHPKEGVTISIWERRHHTGNEKKYSVYVECEYTNTLLVDELPSENEAIYFVENNIRKITYWCDYIAYGTQVLAFINPKNKPEPKKKEPHLS